MIFVKNLTQLGREDGSIAGGKGASLAALREGGFTVPPAFVILARTFSEFIDRTGLEKTIDAKLAPALDPSSQANLKKTSKEIGQLIIEAAMPDEIENELLKTFRQLRCDRVAVRSSATVEDGAQASWAGQFASFLNATEET